MLFRKILIRIRKEYNVQPQRLFIYSGIITAIGLILSIVVDIFLPFSGWSNALRSLLLIPFSASLFTLGYAISLFLHYGRVRTDPEWMPFRARLSPTWRRRVSIIVGAFMFVLIYANGTRIGYTALSSCVVAIIIALFAFIRLTKEEEERERFDIPDARDTRYQNNMKKLEEARAQAKNNKKNRDKKLKNGNEKD